MRSSLRWLPPATAVLIDCSFFGSSDPPSCGTIPSRSSAACSPARSLPKISFLGDISTSAGVVPGCCSWVDIHTPILAYYTKYPSSSVFTPTLHDLFNPSLQLNPKSNSQSLQLIQQEVTKPHLG